MFGMKNFESGKGPMPVLSENRKEEVQIERLV